ncbi:head GIN domain-containing protein [Spongiimicrobium salis]|uniref:head GIN domain-containing protein n=1 Tax=Spongiimicrobium salis TaxID=1667022 RepID=UPI00374D1ADC
MKKILYVCSFLVSFTVFSQRSVTKDVGDFNTIKVFDLIEVNLIKSDKNSVTIKGENVDDIRVVNKNGTLKLRMKLDRIFHGEDTFIEVYYKDLDVIDGNEGARITSNELIKQNTLEIKTQEGAQVKVGLDVNYLKIRSVTGGAIEASGLAKSQEVVLNTGGIFEGRELQTKTSKVKITAAGEADVFATEKVDINVKAGGDVYVYGNPKQVNKKTFAGGRVYLKD